MTDSPLGPSPDHQTNVGRTASVSDFESLDGAVATLQSYIMSNSATRSLNKREEHTHKRAGEKAVALQDKNKPEEAVVLLRENLNLSTRVLGLDHLTTINDQESLSDCLSELGEYAEAVSLDRRTLRTRERIDPAARDTLDTQHSLANNLTRLGKYEKAITLHRKTLASREAALGLYHNDTTETRQSLAASLHENGQYQEATALNREVLKSRLRRLKPDDYDLIACRHNLAANLHALGNISNAMILIHENIATLQLSPARDESQFEEVRKLQAKVQLDIQRAADKKKADRLKVEERKRAKDQQRETALKAKNMENLNEVKRAKEAERAMEAEKTETAALQEAIIKTSAERAEAEWKVQARREEEDSRKQAVRENVERVEAERIGRAKKKRDREEEELRKQASREEELLRQLPKELGVQLQSDLLAVSDRRIADRTKTTEGKLGNTPFQIDRKCTLTSNRESRYYTLTLFFQSSEA